MYMNLPTYEHSHKHMYDTYMQIKNRPSLHVCTYVCVCVHACLYVCMYMYGCVYMYAYVCVFAEIRD